MTHLSKNHCVIILLVFLSLAGKSQSSLFRTGIFLHHSTGANIYGPNGSNTSVPLEMAGYNSDHGYTGSEAVNLTETWFPAYNDNEWSTWHTIFEQGTPEDICTLCMGNPILMIKSCFPSSAVQSAGNPSDTLTPALKTVYNYKWHWRHIIQVLENHPEHFFVIWTNAPLVQSQTNPLEASLSKWFCQWAHDTLAAGLDPVYGAFPPNVYVFDFFQKLTTFQGYLNPMYAASFWDSHPNALATELIAPQLVTETFDAAIAYETSVSLCNITGTLKYNNLTQTPLPNVMIQLKQSCCIIVGTTYTDNAGNFSFNNLSPGHYTIQPLIDIPWGGVNAEDALIILKYFVGLVSLSGLPEWASNLDLNHVTNAADAYYAASRFVELLTFFPVGDWVWVNTQVYLFPGNDEHVNIKALCTGDVDCSYIP
ncbi:MAG: carboxypeptidase-like regulatory domain-containing protein [Bacteroidales bacterium]